MIIDEIIDNYKAKQEWERLSAVEKWETGYDKPIMDFRYIKDEAELFAFDDIYNAIHVLPSGVVINDSEQLRQALHTYVDEQGYAPTIHVMVDAVEL